MTDPPRRRPLERDRGAIRPGLCSIALRQQAPEAIIELAAGAGLAAIEWGADVHVVPGDLPLADRVRRWCADAGLACPSYGTYLMAGKATAADAAVAADTALALGAASVRIWAQLGVPPDGSSADRRRVLDGVVELATTIIGHGLTTSLEYHVDTLTHTAASANAVLDEAGVAGLFTYWQPDWTLPVCTILDEFRAVAHRCSHLHVFVWASYDDRHPLDAGEDLWPAVLREAAHAVQWPGDRYAFLEHVLGDRPEQVRVDAATLRGWIPRAAGPSDGPSYRR